MFRNIFPYYLAMGMTYEEFWYGCPSLVRDYRKAWSIKQQNEECARWRQGIYFFNALLCAAPVMRTAFSKTAVKPGEYPKEPYPLTEKEAKQREENKRAANMKRLLAVLNKESEEAKKQEANHNG